MPEQAPLKPIPPNIHPACRECIQKRRERFGDKADLLECAYIKEDPLEGLDVSHLTEIDKEVLRTNLDPVRWAKNYFDLKLRWYQELECRCTANR